MKINTLPPHRNENDPGTIMWMVLEPYTQAFLKKMIWKKIYE